MTSHSEVSLACGLVRTPWRRVKLSTVLSATELGGNYVPHSKPDGTPLVKMGNMKRGKFDCSAIEYVRSEDVDPSHYLKFGDVLLNTRNTLDLVGKVAIWRNELPLAVFNSNILRFTFNKNLVGSNEFMNLVLNTKDAIRQLRSFATGTTSVAAIYNRDLLNLSFFLPPIAEQSKIAEILTCWDKAIELVERLIGEKRTLKKSLSQRIFFSKHRPTISADSEWITVELRNLLEVSKDKEPISKTRPLFSLTIEHGVTPKTDRYDREALVKDKVAKLYKVVNPMDIVFNPSNLRWGAIGLCRQETPVLVSPIYEVVRVKDPKSTSTEFLFQLLSSERQINFFATLTEGTLIERMAVKVDTFLDQTVCIPSRREDQDALAAILALADREISSLAQLDIELKQQKRGLMQQLLTGKMRVKV